MLAVNNNQVVIITAETGAGKSTRVPQFLLDEGYTLVVTQPRRLAARSVAKRVAQERNCELGGEIGFRTAYERQDGPNTRCLFATDGLALVRELMGVGHQQILILDEVHEWNLNMEVLTAWSKRQIESGSAFKLVIMSATLEAEKLSAFFSGAPIISVPGRCYPVIEQKSSGNQFKDISKLLQEGRNVLVFEPGKKEISQTVFDLKNRGLDAEILELHGELSSEDQDKVFHTYHRPKCVVATNVAQTSITIEDIDAVVDTGMERRIELNEGVEGLYLLPISLADSAQRKGRAGRTHEGIYIDLCSENSRRPGFPVAEILRVRLDQTVLRLAEAKIDAEELTFFHQPPLEQIKEAKKALIALGCMDKGGNVTRIGREVSRLPISVEYGRMIIAAEKYGVVDDILDIASLLEQGGITDRNQTNLWQEKFCSKERGSDVLAQLSVFQGAHDMTNDERRNNGVIVKAYHQTKDRRRLLANALRAKVSSFRSSGKREDILKALCAGMVSHLYQQYGSGYRNGDGLSRRLTYESLAHGEWIVGLPFDLSTRRGTLNLVTMATSVNPELLAEVAPQLVKVEKGLKPKYDFNQDACLSTTKTFFNSLLIKEEKVLDTEHEEAEAAFADWLTSQLNYGYSIAGYPFAEVNAAIVKRAKELNARAGDKVFSYPDSHQEWQEFCREKLLGCKCLKDINPESFCLPEISSKKEEIIITENPGQVIINGEQFIVNYSEANAYIHISEKASLGQSGEYYLPSGRKLEFYFNYKSYRTFEELNAYFEERRIKSAFSNLKSKYSDYQEGEENFISLLGSLGAEPYAVKNNGDKVFAYPVINFSGSSYRITFVDNEVQANKNNSQSMREYLRMMVGNNLEAVNPWYSWGWTPLAQHFLLKSSELLEKVSKDLSSSNFKAVLSELRAKYSSLKEELLSRRKEVERYHQRIENEYSQQTAELDLSFVSDEVQSFSTLIQEAKELLRSVDFDKSIESGQKAYDLIQEIVALQKKRQLEREEIARRNNIPQYLLDAFENDVHMALKFMDKVENLPVHRIDGHEISCGRERVRRHLEAIGGSDFFCGADPNKVKYYVEEYHFPHTSYIEETNKSSHSSWQDNIGSSNDAMTEALRRAGLIK